MQQLLERLSLKTLADSDFSTADAETHASKNRYDYNLPCELLVTTEIYFIICVWLWTVQLMRLEWNWILAWLIT